MNKMNKIKAYDIRDSENQLLGFYKMKRGEARYLAFKQFGKDWGLNFREFLDEVTVRRFPELDIYEFHYETADSMDSDFFEKEDEWGRDEIINYFKDNYKEVEK